MKRLAILALCLIASAACRRDGDGTPSPSIPDPSGHIHAPWVDVLNPDEPDVGNTPPLVSECVLDPAPEAVPTPVDDDGGADVGEPGFTITVTPESFVIPQGGSVDLTVAVTRAEDFLESIEVTVDGLPAGVTASSLNLDPDECECPHTITLSAEPATAVPRPDQARVRGSAVAGTRSVPIAMAVRRSASERDSSLGNNGRVFAGFVVDDLAEQPDGKIVFTGSVGGSEPLTVCRLDVDGAPDSTFGSSDGCARVETGFPAGGRVLAVMPDGRILAAGGREKTAIARFMPSGDLDPTFGDGGWVTRELGAGFSISELLRVGGKIVLAGTVAPCASGGECVWAERFHDSGTIDSAFGTYGRSVFPGRLHGIAPRGDCGFVATTPSRMLAVDWAGELEVFFGSGGYAELPVTGPVARAGADFVVGGEWMSVVRVSGTGIAGPVSVPLTSWGDHTDSARARGVAVLPDGGTVLGGYSSDTDLRVAIARRLPDGSPDAAFGGGGVTTGVADGVGVAGGVAVMRDGRYVLFGSWGYEGAGQILRVWN